MNTFYFKQLSDENELNQFTIELAEMILNTGKEKILVVCIGTDRSTGDSLGPFVGYQLNQRNNNMIQVIGTINHPIHALNMEYYLSFIRERYKEHVIIGIDASVGCDASIGSVRLANESLYPGLGCGKNLSPIGDISITGIVTSKPGGINGVRLSDVLKMVDFICKGINQLDVSYQQANHTKIAMVV